MTLKNWYLRVKMTLKNKTLRVIMTLKILGLRELCYIQSKLLKIKRER